MVKFGEGEGGKIWENGIETCVISCMKRVASPGSMHDTGCLGLVHWDNPEGWCGEGGGRRVQDGERMYTCGGNNKGAPAPLSNTQMYCVKNDAEVTSRKRVRLSVSFSRKGSSLLY